MSHSMRSPIFSRFCGVPIALIFVTTPVASEAGTEEEIAHLLEYVENSNCSFIRNGKGYDAAKARKHLEFKYSLAKHTVKTTEDFISRIATKSSVSAIPYKVRCDSQEIPSADWFKAELIRFRNK